jgi:hypothetical protein
MGTWQILGVSAGGALALVSLWLLRGAKRAIRASDDGLVEGLSGPTRLTLGVTGLLVGYHLAMWSVPALSFGVPLHLWWVVALGGGLAVAGAVAVDLLERGGA